MQTSFFLLILCIITTLNLFHRVYKRKKSIHTTKQNKENKDSKREDNFVEITDEWLERAELNKDNKVSVTIHDTDIFVHKGVTYKQGELVYDKFLEMIVATKIVQDISSNELSFARMFSDKFKVDIMCLPRIVRPQKIETPDFIISNKHYDLKEIKGNGKNTLDSSIKNKKDQSNNFIFDLNKSFMSIEIALGQINEIYYKGNRYWVDELIVTKSNVFIFFKRK